MPIYEYFCSACDKVHEVRQGIMTDALTQCPACESNNIRKLVSRSSFHLKGTGWYATDYAAKGNTTQNSDGEKGAKDSDKTEGTKEKGGKAVEKASESKSTISSDAAKT